MSISQDILYLVSQDPVEGAIAICRSALEQIEGEDNWTEESHAVLLEATAALMSLYEGGRIENGTSDPDVEGHMGYICNNLRRFLVDSLAELVGQSSAKKLNALKKGFDITLSNGFGYEFTEGDIQRVQELINELRAELSKESRLDAGHKQRLLKRLEELQKELHKKVSDLNRFYGLIGDLGVTFGKLGTDAKPFTDRIRELIGIAWKAQARAEELPSSAENPVLGSDNQPPKLN